MRFDLDELAAPIEELRPRLDEAYQDLNDEWKTISKRLRAISVPCRVSLELPRWQPDAARFLEWRKQGKAWRFCLVTKKENAGGEEVVTVRPLPQWTAQERMNTLQHVPDFFAEAEKRTRWFIRKASESRAKCTTAG